MKQITLLVFFSICTASASAQVLLKPSGQGAAPLATKAIVADVDIRGQFASTTLDLTFQNQIHGQVEADFVYTLPPDTAVTYFAYWFKDEKVVARIVEKERAAAIYSHITSRNRDPALIEMIGKNTFRARIFPVEANADLRVEMKLVQTLPADSTGATYELPLYQEKGQPLDSVAIRVRVHPDDLTVRVENNLGISVLTDQAGYRFTIEGRNYRPQKDLRVRLVRTPVPLQASLYSARSGGADGFFALALVSAWPVEDPKVKVDGIRTYDLVPAAARNSDGHTTLTLYGRYHGSGDAKVSLTGRSDNGPVTLSAPIQFSDSVEPNNLASKLWAKHRIEALSESGRNRSAVVEVSKRYALPSMHTSWLAVPVAEMARYQEEKRLIDLDRKASRLAYLISRGNGAGREARNLRSEIWSLAKTGDNPRELIRAHMSQHTWSIGSELANLIAQGRDRTSYALRLKRRLTIMASQAGDDVSEVLREYLQDHMMTAAREYAVSTYGGEAVEVHSNRPEGLSGYASDIVNKTRHDAARARAALARLHKMARLAHADPEEYLRYYRRSYQQIESERLRDQIAKERRKESVDQDRLARMEDRFRSLNETLRGKPYADARLERLATSIELDIVDRKLSRNPDPELRRHRVELASRLDGLRVRMGDPLIQVEAPEDAEHVVAILPGGEIKRLAFNADSGRWEARFDVPTYAAEGVYEITIIIVRKDGRRSLLVMRYHVDITPPKAAGFATEIAGSRRLRLELESDPNTARVSALLPWGEKVELRATPRTGQFYTLTQIPESFADPVERVTYVITDRAHNRTVLTVDLAEGH